MLLRVINSPVNSILTLSFFKYRLHSLARVIFSVVTLSRPLLSFVIFFRVCATFLTRFSHCGRWWKRTSQEEYARIILIYTRGGIRHSKLSRARQNSPLIKTRLAGRANPAASTLAVPAQPGTYKCITTRPCGLAVAVYSARDASAMLGFHDPIIPT